MYCRMQMKNTHSYCTFKLLSNCTAAFCCFSVIQSVPAHYFAQDSQQFFPLPIPSCILWCVQEKGRKCYIILLFLCWCWRKMWMPHHFKWCADKRVHWDGKERESYSFIVCYTTIKHWICESFCCHRDDTFSTISIVDLFFQPITQIWIVKLSVIQDTACKTNTIISFSEHINNSHTFSSHCVVQKRRFPALKGLWNSFWV